MSLNIFLYPGASPQNNIILSDPTVARGGSSATVTLSAVSGVGAIASLSVELVLALAGVVGTGVVGALTPEEKLALSGVSGAGAVAAFLPEDQLALASIAGTGAVALLGAGEGSSLSSVGGTGAVGSLSTQLGVSLSFVSGAGAVGSLGMHLVVSLAPVSGAGSVGALAAEVDALLVGVAGSGAVAGLAPSIDVSTTLGSVAGTGAVAGLVIAQTVPEVAGGGGEVGQTQFKVTPPRRARATVNAVVEPEVFEVSSEAIVTPLKTRLRAVPGRALAKADLRERPTESWGTILARTKRFAAAGAIHAIDPHEPFELRALAKVTDVDLEFIAYQEAA